MSYHANINNVLLRTNRELLQKYVLDGHGRCDGGVFFYSWHD